MTMPDIEATLKADDLNAELAGVGAPRVTYDHIKGRIVGEFYFTAHDGAAGASRSGGMSFAPPAACVGSLSLLTICVLVLDNGFTATGESACASPENFNAAFGKELARKQAIDKVWTLEAYLLRERLSENARGLEIAAKARAYKGEPS